MAAAAAKKPGFRTLMRAMRNRKTGFMALFGFASGLPFALFLGTLYAWLTEAEVDLETMGVFSLIGLAYAFQFLWSPLVDRIDIPLFRKLGKRKQWIVPAQLVLGAVLVIMSALDPGSSLGMFSLLAAIGAFASATQDIAINAWRIDIADEDATLDILSTVYQMGFRLSSLVGGALALILAARIGWPQTYLLMGGILLAIGVVGLFAPDADVVAPTAEQQDAMLVLRRAGQLSPKLRMQALLAIGALWGAALLTVIVFMVMSMTAAPDERPDPTAFTATAGPLIVIATIVLPALIAGWLVGKQRNPALLLQEDVPVATGGAVVADHLYRALVLPLVEFVGRLGWSLVLILALVLTYRICDAIWGTFAYPFYLGELKYSNDEVAVASKFFGVGAIVLGLAIGGTLLTAIGRMATLTLGAVLAALTNLLYADLARGGITMQAFADAIGFTNLVQSFGARPEMAKLMLAIGAENLAVGIAGAAYVAWLSSIVAKGYSAVQYALLSSLTLLVGTLGRGALGQAIEERGYYNVFLFTTAIGGIAVVLCLAEWYRQSRTAQAGVVAPEPA
ncbi:MFS transporter [Altererythrobacter sp. TH136]|uniref:AmpG family muropeptide MFS transporter n=1 Tax=Altererythrobacter sp. TH136 TaxID=2067415 RepID=UPI001162E0E8|nr:MFS transporter [Altererythrobacter sp. TH136]QDM40296.1 AmpG family muropeptide MFS transporter [Altererythrobacter sp. TH136]